LSQNIQNMWARVPKMRILPKRCTVYISYKRDILQKRCTVKKRCSDILQKRCTVYLRTSALQTGRTGGVNKVYCYQKMKRYGGL